MREPYKRISHGVIPSWGKLKDAEKKVGDLNRDADLPFSFAITGKTTRFDYLFPDLQNEDALLPESPDTRARLVNLGITMMEPNAESADSTIPSAYTYLGQFIDHDITFETKSDDMVKLEGDDFRVLTPEEIRDRITNGRTPALDLDNLYYKPAPKNCSRMLLGYVSSIDPNEPPPGKANDLPRKPRSSNRAEDRAALIGDKRDDENLVISQLHVAFLRAHNAIAAKNHTFNEARTILRQHYQWLVIKDFLPRICDPWIVNDILLGGNRFFRPDLDDLFMPFEFSVAAYRFGHSMVRNEYHYNANFPRAGLTDLFMLTALSGNLRDFDSLPENWIIEWENFIEGGINRARPINTGLSEALFGLRAFNKPMPVEARLPVRNLLRGYMLRLPTGQAVAKALGLPVLTSKDIEQVARSNSEEQLAAVRDGEFLERTPLWYYILAEAAADSSERLGPVGSTIVAEVLIGLIRGSKDSILRQTHWKPTLGQTPDDFTLRDLFELGGVLANPSVKTFKRRTNMSKRIMDLVMAKKALMTKDPSEAGRNSALAIAAIKGGIKSPEWRSYMMQFVEQNPPGTALDPKKLDRLLGNDGTNGHPRLDMARTYLVANGVCGPDTPAGFAVGVESIDEGIDPGCPTSKKVVTAPRKRRGYPKKSGKKSKKSKK